MRMMGRKTVRTGGGRLGAMTALAMVLAVGACSTVEDGWDYVFGDDPPATVAAPAEGEAVPQAAAEGDGEEPAPAAEPAAVPEGLHGDPSPPDYGPGLRRMPTSTRALVDEPPAAPRRAVAESVTPAAAPAPSPAPSVVAVAPAPIPAPIPAPTPASVPSAPQPAPAATPSVAKTVPPALPPAAAAAESRVQRADLAPPPAVPAAPAVVPPAAPLQAVSQAVPRTAPAVHQTLPHQTVAEASVPLVPDTPAGEVLANSPRPGIAPMAPELAAAPPPRLDIPASAPRGALRLVAPPMAAPTASAGPGDLLIAPSPAWDGGGGVGAGLDDLGTTVIGGDGRVVSDPAPMVASPVPMMAAMDQEPYGFDIVTPEVPLSMTGGETLVATIQFEHGSASLTEGERRLLRQVVEMQRQYGGVIQVVGHASSRTVDMSMDRHMMVNYTTSARRAEAVARALRSLGAPDNAVVAVAQSDNMPIYREIMPSGEAGNRRAEVYLVN